MSLTEFLIELPECHAYPAYNRKQERIEFWLSDKLLGWITVQALAASGDWKKAYMMFEQHRIWRLP